MTKSKFKNIMRYKAAVAVFKIWFEKELIGAEELRLIDELTAEKCGFSPNSIYVGPYPYFMSEQ